jgi:hypothetical protein
MKRPAVPWMTLLAAVVAMPFAAAADRFVPDDPRFVVADVSRSQPDDSLRALVGRWRADPGSEESRVALARAFIERARSQREPRYFGRAEALLAPAAGAGNSVERRRLYAETLQFRHAFAPAEDILDELLRAHPHDGESRLRRASLRLTRGDFAGARADCLPLTSARGPVAYAGAACLAEALAGSGELARARLLLDTLAPDSDTLEPAVRAYLLSTRAELLERAGDFAMAAESYAIASALAPQDDAIRSAWSDALALRGDAGAAAPLKVANPSLALLVRQAALSSRQPSGDALPEHGLFARAHDWLALEAARGDAIHHREAALLALAEGRASAALSAASTNFETQRELADVRVLARAAVAAGDVRARDLLERWLEATGYEDAVTSDILATPGRGRVRP